MIVKDLEGNESKLSVKSNNNTKSKLHKEAVNILRKIIPGVRLCQDLSVKVKPGLTLYLDIFIPSLEFTIEIHGKQHYNYTPYFHKHEHRYGRAKLNDELKKEWCNINGIGFLELAYNESGEWERQIREAIRRYTGRVLQ